MWYPTRTDSVGSASNSSTGYASSTTPVSWSKIRKYVPRNRSSQRILWPSFMSSHAGTTDCDDTPAPQTITKTRCQKIRLYPTPSQANTLRTWAKAARATYNTTLRLVNDKKVEPSNYPELKKRVVSRRADDDQATLKLKETPADIRVRAILDLRDAFHTARAGFFARLKKLKTQKNRWKKKKKKEKIKKRRRWKKRKAAFIVKYKSRRLTSDSFGFEKKSVKVKNKQLFLFSSQTKFNMREGIRMGEDPRQPIDTCCRVQYYYGRWYFLLPYKEDSPPEPRIDEFASLDPGVRTFQTYYSESEAGEIGVDMEPCLDAINRKISGIQARLQEAKALGDKVKAMKLRRAWHRANARSSNLVSDLHWKTIKFLLDRYDAILAPRLNVQSLLQTNLPAIVKARMVTQRHGEFINRLKIKAASRNKIVITDFEEHGTSMSCGLCGHINRHLGSSKEFKCGWCGFEVDRDINSARIHSIKLLAARRTIDVVKQYIQRGFVTAPYK